MLSNVTVGRDSELERLARLLADAVEGRGSTCFISGEAGSGKSTLVQEFVARGLSKYSDLVVAVGACDAQVGISDPYLPFVDLVAEFTGHVESKIAQGKLTENAAGRLRRVAGVSANLLLEFAPDLLGTLIPGSSLVVRMVKMAAEKSGMTDRLTNLGATKPGGGELRIDQQQIFESYTRLLRGMAKQSPVVIVLDDLHWSDAPSCSLLFHLAQSIRDSRLLIIGTYRANDIALGYGTERHPMTPVINELKRYQGDIIIDLDGFDDRKRRLFVRQLIDSEPNEISDEWCDALMRHTHGHALFTVELLLALRDRGLLARNERGAWVAPPSIDWSVLPSRVEGVIEERIGRLEDELRDVLRVASVEGEVFTAEIVARIQEVSERSLLSSLSQELGARHRLVSEGDVERIGRSFISHYAFTHALFQKYFYDHLGRRERMLLHQNVAELLEELYAGHLDDVSSQLAHHYVHAGNPEKAFGYVMAVATRALRVSAYEEALRHGTVALDLLFDMPERDRPTLELDVQILRGSAFEAIDGWGGPRTLDALARALELAEQLPPTPRTVPLIFRHVAKPLGCGRHKEARAIVEQLNDGRFAETASGRLMLAAIDGMTAFWMGRIIHSRDVSTEVSKWRPDAVENVDDNIHRVLLLRQLMLDEFILGDADLAQRYCDQAVAAAEQFAHRFTISIARAAVAWNAWHLRDPQRVRAAVDAGLAAGAGTFPFYHRQLRVFGAWADAMTGTPDPIGCLDAAYDGFAREGTYFHSIQSLIRAEIHLMTGNLQEGIESIDSNIRIALEICDLVYLSELYRLRGDMLLGLDRSCEAAESYRNAIRIASEQQAQTFERLAAAALERASMPQAAAS